MPELDTRLVLEPLSHLVNGLVSQVRSVDVPAEECPVIPAEIVGFIFGNVASCVVTGIRRFQQRFEAALGVLPLLRRLQSLQRRIFDLRGRLPRVIPALDGQPRPIAEHLLHRVEGNPRPYHEIRHRVERGQYRLRRQRARDAARFVSIFLLDRLVQLEPPPVLVRPGRRGIRQVDDVGHLSGADDVVVAQEVTSLRVAVGGAIHLVGQRAGL
mmetsp:Transcript_12516/g.26960  ORF Transcript_12516/g.26960 Transcript_12516/m.26960 type:complete len:213 (-) Transcript_12516:479-1117(-)